MKSVELSQDNLNKALNWFKANFSAKGNIFKGANNNLEKDKALKELSEIPNIFNKVISDINVAHNSTQDIIKGQVNEIAELKKQNKELIEQNRTQKLLVKGQGDDIDSIKASVELLSNTPQKPKSLTQSYLVKGGENKLENENNNQVTYSIARNKLEINSLLGSKMEKEIQKGMGGGEFTTAAVVFESQKQISPQIIKKLQEEDNIFITN